MPSLPQLSQSVNTKVPLVIRHFILILLSEIIGAFGIFAIFASLRQSVNTRKNMQVILVCGKGGKELGKGGD